MNIQFLKYAVEVAEQKSISSGALFALLLAAGVSEIRKKTRRFNQDPGFLGQNA